MNFIQIGREALPREKKMRKYRAAIVDIKSDRFVVILKYDRTKEMVHTYDLILTDRIYTEEELNSKDCDLFDPIPEEPVKNDFERYVENLKKKLTKEILSEEMRV